MENSFQALQLSGNRYEIRFSLPDFLGLLSVVTGLFASHGISILTGSIKTEGGWALDSFEVSVEEPVDWDEFRNRLFDFTQQMRTGKTREVRREVHRLIIAYLQGHRRDYAQELYPMDLRIDQEISESETLIDIRSQDTPAFLYELTNALALLGINIARMEISTLGQKVLDKLWVTDETGAKITEDRKLKSLQWAVLLMKHFSHLLPKVPDPEAALEQIILFGKDVFDRHDFSDILLTLRKSRVLNDLSKILGTSRFLWEEFLRTQHESIFPLLSGQLLVKKKKNKAVMRRELGRRVEQQTTFDEKVRVLNEYKDHEMFRIDLRHILGRVSYLGEFAEEFTDLAETVTAVAYELAWDETARETSIPMVSGTKKSAAAVMALGKYGGRELGYASDLELLFVYSDHPDSASLQSQENLKFYSTLVRVFSKIIHARAEGVFQIDLRLRPYGKDGPLAASFHLFEKYYSASGEAWDYERQALVKLRAVAGDRRLGRTVEKLRDGFVYSPKPFDFKEVLRWRQRQKNELVEEGTSNAKYSGGGLLDLEYLVQSLQIAFGIRFEEVRRTNTLKALDALWRLGALEEKNFQSLRSAYIFLRGVINALRIVRGNAKDLTIPKQDTDEFVSLGRRIGYVGTADTVRKEFAAAFERHRQVAARLFDAEMQALADEGWEQLQNRIATWVPPVTSPFSLDEILRGELSGPAWNELQRLGFANRSEICGRLQRICPNMFAFEAFSRVMERSWPVWAKVPDADMALQHFGYFLDRYESKDVFWDSLDYSEEGFLILLTVFGYSRYLSEILIAHPEYWQWIQHRKSLSLEHTQALLSQESEKGLSASELRRIKDRETLRIVLAEFFSGAEPADVFLTYTRLAEWILEKAVRLAFPHGEVCVMGLGKLGGEDLNYSSDIDLMFIVPDAPDDAKILREVQAFLKILRRGDLSEFLYRVDLRLRPHGENGKLYLTLSEAAEYYRKTADTWEYQMMLKARPVAGKKVLGETLLREISPLIYRSPWANADLERLRDVKRRYEEMTRAKNETETNIKLGTGGIRDIEFSIQILQLKHGAGDALLQSRRTLEALKRIQERGLLGSLECEKLREGYILLRRIENNLQIFENRQVHELPSDPPKWRWLAKSLGFVDAKGYADEGRLMEKLAGLRADVRLIFERLYFED